MDLNNDRIKRPSGYDYLKWEKCNKLNEKMKQNVYTIMVKGLFWCKSVNPDIQTVISFLTNRVKETDKDDWEIVKINDIFEWHKIISFDINCQWNEHSEMVCGRKLRDLLRNEEPNGNCNNNVKRKYNFKTTTTETEHKNKNGSIISWC